MLDNQHNCLSESLIIVTSNNSLWQSQAVSVTIIIFFKRFSLTCQVSSVQEASSSGHRNRSRLRKVVKAIFCWTYHHAMMAVIVLGLITMALMMHLRRVRVGAMKVKVPPCTIGSRHPKVLWWEFFRTKLFQWQWSNEATMWIVI